MAKDRYSDDHTLEVVGDTKTVNIKDNLSVSDLVTSPEVKTELISTDSTLEINAVNPSGEIDILAYSAITIEAQGVLIGGQALNFERIPTVISPGDAVTRYKSYPAVAFVPEYGATSFRIEDPPYLQIRSTTTRKVWAPITDLPDGSVISTVGLTYERSDTGDVFSVAIGKINNTTGAFTSVGGGGVFNIVGTVEYAEIVLGTNVTIDYEDYSYVIQVSITDDSVGNTKLYGARITYTSNSAGK
jgi:hypothetical protein